MRTLTKLNAVDLQNTNTQVRIIHISFNGRKVKHELEITRSNRKWIQKTFTADRNKALCIFLLVKVLTRAWHRPTRCLRCELTVRPLFPLNSQISPANMLRDQKFSSEGLGPIHGACARNWVQSLLRCDARVEWAMDRDLSQKPVKFDIQRTVHRDISL